MTVTAYKTQKISVGMKLNDILDATLPILSDRDIVVVTSKIVSICEGQVVAHDGKVTKKDLIRREAELYIEGKSLTRYGIILTMKRGIVIPSAGIDESNGGGNFILWPKDPDKSAVDIWQSLRAKHGVRHLGVIITDSHTTPLRWGVTGIGLSWCGFSALNDYIGKPDINGRKLRVTKANVLDGLSAASTAVMGEGNEQTPLAVIQDTGFVTFQNRPPSVRERQNMIIDRKKDIYADLMDSPYWRKGGSSVL